MFFRPCELLSRKVLVEATAERNEVLHLTFGLPKGSSEMNIDISVGEHIKIRSYGLLPLARSYSPVAVRPGQFDLIVKVYPRTFKLGLPAFVSDHLSKLQVGDQAKFSGPYPPPFMHMVRNIAPRVGIIALGVGITEAIGVIAGLPDEVQEIVLLWALRDRSELYAEEMLSELVKKKGTKLVIKYHFSKEAGKRFDESTLSEVFPWNSGSESQHSFLAVGTKKMMRSTYAMLISAGLAHQKLLSKKFGKRPPQLSAL